ncbi:hypothetical protein ACHQM5_013883 [Ranunculus cassubicifolius]
MEDNQHIPDAMPDFDKTESESDSDEEQAFQIKKRKLDSSGIVLPPGFLDPLPTTMNAVPLSQVPPPQPSNPPLYVAPLSQAPMNVAPLSQAPAPTPAPRQPPVSSCKQFWKAGDYEVPPTFSSTTGGLDHARVHPKFLHSNATSHKWVLGAFAELLDNSVDEIANGATYVAVDVLENQKDGNKMLLVQDNGGGMNTDTVRHCMSLGYSVKSKLANTIGQYGNGFKTSTMRLGADVLVFSRCMGKDGKNATQSIGMLSYSFLRRTGKDDIVVPVIDYEQINNAWRPILRSSLQDWNMNLESIVQWSPYSSQADLLQQFNLMGPKGTRVIVYNLWEDDNGKMELDFDTDQLDIQIRDANRDEAMIEMAKKYPSARHFVNYRHSLRSYASILYLRLPPSFRIILRGHRVDHHNMVDDMMLVKKSQYRPMVADNNGVWKNQNDAVADVTVGFVKDAKDHIDIQGFNVYHKNRLIKPFWRVWNAAGSGGRGIIGVLEANFVEPAHDKQGFESTNVLQRLSYKLQELQKSYWKERSHEIGYASAVSRSSNKRSHAESETKNDPPANMQPLSSKPRHGGFEVCNDSPAKMQPLKEIAKKREDDHGRGLEEEREKARSAENQCNAPATRPETTAAVEKFRSFVASNPVYQNIHQNSGTTTNIHQRSLPDLRAPPSSATTTVCAPRPITVCAPPSSATTTVCAPTTTSTCAPRPTMVYAPRSGAPPSLAPTTTVSAPRPGATIQVNKDQLERIKNMVTQLKAKEEQCLVMEAQLKEKDEKIDTLEKEAEKLIEIFTEERNRRDNEEAKLRSRVKEADMIIEELRKKMAASEKIKQEPSY